MAFITQNAAVSTSSSGDNTIAAAVAGKRIVLVSYVVINNAATAQNVTWKSGASTSMSGSMALPSSIGGSVGIAGADQQPLLVTAAGDALVLNLSAATAVSGHCAFYYR
jgi:hypothetical protein